MASEYTEDYVSTDNGKTFHTELLKRGQVKAKREMGQIVNKHPCHKCYHWYNPLYPGNPTCINGGHVENGVCMGFEEIIERSEEEIAQDRYDAFNEEWN